MKLRVAWEGESLFRRADATPDVPETFSLDWLRAQIRGASDRLWHERTPGRQVVLQVSPWLYRELAEAIVADMRVLGQPVGRGLSFMGFPVIPERSLAQWSLILAEAQEQMVALPVTNTWRFDDLDTLPLDRMQTFERRTRYLPLAILTPEEHPWKGLDIGPEAE